MNRKYFFYVGFGFLFCVLLITRLWRIAMVPFGLHLDEAGMAYDAWCLSQYGVDRYLNSWPLYLTNYGGGQSILYAYICAGLFRLFGYHYLLIRLPAIVFSAVTFLFGIKLMGKIFPGEHMPSIVVGILLIICPALILQGRIGIDCYLMLGVSTVFLYLFFCAVESGLFRYYFGAGLVGGLLLYTYALTYFVLPLFLGFSLFYVIRVKKFSIHGWIIMAMPLALLASPLIMIQIINMFDLPEMKLGCFTLTKMNMYRISEFSGFHFEWFVTLIRVIFVGNELAYTAAPGFFNFYILTIPLFLIGICDLWVSAWRSIRKREHNGQIYILIWFFIIFFLFCHLKPIGYRVTGIYYSVIAIAACGFRILFRFFCKRIAQKAALAMTVVLAVGYMGGFARFGYYYFMGEYTVSTAPLTHFDILVTEGIEYLEAHPEYQNQGTYMAEPVTFYMLSTLASPYEIQYDIHTLDSDYYICGSLPEIQDGYNYIVRVIYDEYANELRNRGYKEVKFTGYSLFYQDQ